MRVKELMCNPSTNTILLLQVINKQCLYNIHIALNKEIMAQITEQQFNALVEANIANILRAVEDYQNNPVKSKEYITRKIRDISKASVLFSEISITEELFG